MYDDFDSDTDVTEIPWREPAPAVIHDVPKPGAVPVRIKPEKTERYFFPPTRVVVTLCSWVTMLALALFGGGCLAHIEPAPRASTAQYLTVVEVRSWCSDFAAFSDADEPDLEWRGARVGTGVLISGRHVLTAAHVVACPVIPTVRVKLADGRRLRVVVEREDSMADIARLELASADSFGDIVPPQLAGVFEGARRCAVTRWGKACGEGHSVLVTPTRAGDSGAPVYTTSGLLAGIVIGGSAHLTAVSHVDATWLEGT